MCVCAQGVVWWCSQSTQDPALKVLTTSGLLRLPNVRTMANISFDDLIPGDPARRLQTKNLHCIPSGVPLQGGRSNALTINFRSLRGVDRWWWPVESSFGTNGRRARTYKVRDHVIAARVPHCESHLQNLPSRWSTPRVRHFSRIGLSHWTDSQKRKSTVRLRTFTGFADSSHTHGARITPPMIDYWPPWLTFLTDSSLRKALIAQRPARQVHVIPQVAREADPQIPGTGDGHYEISSTSTTRSCCCSATLDNNWDHVEQTPHQQQRRQQRKWHLKRFSREVGVVVGLIMSRAMTMMQIGTIGLYFIIKPHGLISFSGNEYLNCGILLKSRFSLNSVAGHVEQHLFWCVFALLFSLRMWLFLFCRII